MKTVAVIGAAIAGSVALAAGVSVVTPAAPTVQRPTVPGATNPAVTQRTIAATVCVHGWTATIRPPASYTTRLKRQQLRLLRLPGSPGGYEEDHLVPLELGGAPRDPENLWPEPWPQARRTDHEENRLHAQVCAGELRLDAARTLIRAWKRSNG